MSDNQQQNNGDKKKNPDTVYSEITTFLGEDLLKKVKIDDEMLREIITELHEEDIQKTKEKVKAQLKGIIEDKTKLGQAEATFKKAQQETAKSLQDRLNNLRNMVVTKRKQIEESVENLTKDVSEINVTFIGGNSDTPNT